MYDKSTRKTAGCCRTDLIMSVSLIASLRVRNTEIYFGLLFILLVFWLYISHLSLVIYFSLLILEGCVAVN